MSPTQAVEIQRRLSRDALVDVDLIRRWNDAGYLPIAITEKDDE